MQGRYINGRTAIWWLMLMAIAVAIKYHYSTATVQQLDWMLRPLSLLLEWFSGYSFQRNALNEWASHAADIRLAKGCAGINFLLMSLLAWGWIMRPDPGARTAPGVWLAGRLMLLPVMLVAAWSCSLIANSIRILVAMNLQSEGADLHRLVGVLVYVPILSIQLFLGTSGHRGAAVLGPWILYALIMAVVPMLTGNAFSQRELFLRHMLVLLWMGVALGSIYLVGCIRISKPWPISRSGLGQQRRSRI